MWTLHASTPYGLSGWLHEIVDEDGVCVTVAETHVGLGTPWCCLEDGCDAFGHCVHTRVVSEAVTMSRGAECASDAGGAATLPRRTFPPSGVAPAWATGDSANAACTAPLPSGTAPLRAKNPRRTRKQREALYREAQANLPGWMRDADAERTAWLREVQTNDFSHDTDT